MNKRIVYTGIIAAILFFLSLALLSAVLGDPVIFTMVGTGEGKQYSIILEDGNEQQEERNIQLTLFDRADAGRINVLSPNSQGRGYIHLQNTSRHSMRYTLNFSDENNLDVPILFRVRNQSNEIIIGSESSWVSVAELGTITSDLMSGDQTQYAIEWMWDSLSDLSDTEIGIQALDPASYKLSVDIYSKPIGYISDSPELTKNNIIFVVLAVLFTGVITTVTYMVVKDKKVNP